jgi:hypothetical protein
MLQDNTDWTSFKWGWRTRAATAQAAAYQVFLCPTAVGCSLYFLSGINVDTSERTKEKLSLAMVLYSFMLFGFLIPGFTTEKLKVSILEFPPMQVIIEAMVLGFLVSGLYDVFEERS